MNTNFAAMTDEQYTVWSLDWWAKARNLSFANKFTGTDQNSVIQRITELTKTKKGARAVVTLVNDLEGDGRAGDRTLEGNEDALVSEDQVIQVDQLRNANRSKGKMAEQRSIVRFREQSRDKLAYWVSDRQDQLAFLTMSGVSYNLHTNGAPRVGSDLPLLDFAADVKPPSPGRYFTYEGQTLTEGSSNAALAAGDIIDWAMLVNLKAIAKERYMREIRSTGGVVFYHFFVTPTVMAQLRLDPDYLTNVRNAGVRGPGNELFKGTDTVYVDGMAISEYRHVFNTSGMASGSKWGAAGNVDGARVLFCGAQALACADIGAPEWVEKEFDFNNQPGISTGKIFGYLKPQFEGKLQGGQSSGVVEDFGVMCIDVATTPAA